MNAEDKYRQIANRLLEKTRADQARWNELLQEPDPSHRRPREVYYITLPKSQIRLSYNTPVAEPDFITLAFHASSGQEIDSWIIDEDNPDWKLMRNLWGEVRLRARGWDAVLKEIENAVQAEGVIGRTRQS